MVEGGCLVTFINILLFIWDFITYPFYFLIQQPWRKTMKMKKTRARIVTTQASEAEKQTGLLDYDHICQIRTCCFYTLKL